jgi:hypothetical protein
MKKIMLFLLTLVLIQTVAYAMPVINIVSINPQQLWIGESTVVTANCYDNENKTITSVYSETSGPGIILPRLDFSGSGGLYIGDYSQFKSYLNRVGDYYVTVFCNNSEDQSASASTSFTISKLTNQITYADSTGYMEDEVEMDMIVKKDLAVLTSGVSFNVTFNDQATQLKIPPAYDIVKGWILKINPPSSEGQYNLKVYAYYDRANTSNTTSVSIVKKIDFEIVGISNSWVRGGENITISLRARDGNSVIDLNKNILSVQIASTNLEILSLDRNGDMYDVLVTTPIISAGTFEVKANLNYQGNVYTNKENIYYVVNVNGEITDDNNKVINTQLRFLSGSVEKLKLYTDSSGYYSGTLPPGVYDVQLTFPQSTLYLMGVSLNDFNDPIKYFYSTDAVVPGIRNSGLFSYEVALTYTQADITMSYNEKNLVDEDNIIVLKCSNWNSGRKICNSNWFEIGADVDTVRNLAKANLSSLSAFVIGERKAIDVSFNLDSTNYYIGSPIKVRGFVRDVDGDPVSNATVKAKIKNTDYKSSITSDKNGVFSFDFKAPDIEGTYNIDISAEESPYLSFSGSKSFDVMMSRTVEIMLSDTVKLKQGQSVAQEFSIANTGQADLTNLKLSLTGLPESYYNMTKFVEKLNKNEEDKLYIYFNIPENAEKKTTSVTLEVSNDQIKQEKIFGLTVVGSNDIIVNTTPSGRFVMPTIDSNVTYIAVFAIASFSVAVILKKLRIKKSKRDDIRGFLFDVKEYFRRRPENVKSFDRVPEYKELILSQFPNSTNRDKHGKNN